MTGPVFFDMASPENAAPLPEADVYAAVRDFVLQYAFPAPLPEQILQGWENGSSLLPDFGSGTGPDDFAIMSILSCVQQGTTLESYVAPDPDRDIPGILSLKALIKVAVLVGFSGASDVGRLRAQRLAIVARSSAGTRFFDDRGLGDLYAGDVRGRLFSDVQQRPFRLYATTLHLSLWSGVRVELPYFDQASMARLELVDAHHPVT